MMAQRPISFLVVLLLIFYGENFGQKNPQNLQGKSSDRSTIIGETMKELISKERRIRDEYRAIGIHSRWILDGLKEKMGNYSIVSGSSNLSFVGSITPFHYLFHLSPPDYTEHPGWFCKKELQLDKITTIPVRLRLGSLNYVNWMEQKPNANKE